VTPDSVSYLTAATTLFSRGPMVDYFGQPYAMWPPLYPVLLAAIRPVVTAAGIDLVEAIRWLNAATLAATVFLAGCIVRRSVASLFWSTAAVIAIGGAWPLVSVAARAWSEPLFTLFVVAFLWLLPRCLDDASYRTALPLAGITALACLQRYLGVTVALTGVLSIALFASADTRSKRIRLGAIYAFVSLGPLAIWLGRNLTLTGSAFGPRAESSSAAFSRILELSRLLGTWVAPPRDAATTALGVLAVALLIFRVASSRKPAPAVLWPPVLLVGLYTLSVLVSATSVALDPIDHVDERLMAPLYVVLVLIVCLLLSVPPKRPRRAWGPGNVASAVVVAAWLLWAPLTTLEIRSTALAQWCCGYSRWQPSPLLGGIKAHSTNAVFLSNVTFPLYAGIESRSLPPTAEELRRTAQDAGATHVAWFFDDYRNVCGPDERYCYGARYDIDTLIASETVTVLQRFPDGVLFVLKPGA